MISKKQKKNFVCDFTIFEFFASNALHPPCIILADDVFCWTGMIESPKKIFGSDLKSHIDGYRGELRLFHRAKTLGGERFNHRKQELGVLCIKESTRRRLMHTPRTARVTQPVSNAARSSRAPKSTTISVSSQNRQWQI